MSLIDKLTITNKLSPPLDRVLADQLLSLNATAPDMKQRIELARCGETKWKTTN